MNAAREFFRQSESERVKHYSADTKKTTRLSTSFNVSKEKVSNWRDFLRLHCYPIEDFINEWPSTPISFREVTAEYATSVRALVLTLLEAISESLGLAKDRVSNTIGKHGQHMAINYYPRCPQPELTYGLPGHKDANLITVLLQDEVSGLQVFKDGKWIAVNPVPNTFIVNLGDQMQVIRRQSEKKIICFVHSLCTYFMCLFLLIGYKQWKIQECSSQSGCEQRHGADIDTDILLSFWRCCD